LAPVHRGISPSRGCRNREVRPFCVARVINGNLEGKKRGNPMRCSRSKTFASVKETGTSFEISKERNQGGKFLQTVRRSRLLIMVKRGIISPTKNTEGEKI